MTNSFYKQLLEEEQVLRNTLESIEELKLIYGQKTDNISVDNFKESNLSDNTPQYLYYNKKWILEKKVLYVFKILKKATAHQVAKKLIEIDDTLTEKKANSAATSKLSILYRQNKIGAEKEGIKYKYYIKEDEKIGD